VVKTTVDKRTDAIKEIFVKTRNLLKIEDWNGISQVIEQIIKEMNKCVDKAFATDKNQTLPGWVLKVFLELKESIDGVTNKQKKDMKKDVQKCYNSAKTTFTKYLAAAGDEDTGFFAGQLEKYKADPSSFADAGE
jgi:abortive infection bacteriophage resistance protein